MALPSLQKLNALHSTFVDQDNGRLSRGEVDAIAGFYKGLPARSQDSIRDRMIEIYRESTFSRGQKDFFRNLLQGAGFSTEELEGISAKGAEGFAKLPKAEQFDRLVQLGGDWGDGFSVKIASKDIAPGARSAIAKNIAAFEKDYRAERAGDGIDYMFEGERYQAVYLEEGAHGKGKELVGYMAELGIYTGDHDVDQMLYFNRKGEALGSRYHGE